MQGDQGNWDPRVPLTPLRPGDPGQFGQYRVLGRLGSGGLGDAYLAQDDKGWVVVKAVRPGVADTTSLRARLGREISAISMIDSPYVASLLDSDLNAERPWFAMEFVPGITLERAVSEDGPLRPADVLRFSRTLAEAIAAVHAAGVIHRDLKPANVMLAPSGPRLIDFGIADVAGGTRLTQEGATLGTLFWMSPEQVIGEQATNATDVHAWALITIFAATGRAPFSGETSVAAMYQALNVTPTMPQGYPQELTYAVDRALAKDPRRRPTLAEILEMLPADPSRPAAAGAAPKFWATPQPGAGPAAYHYWGTPPANLPPPPGAAPGKQPPQAPPQQPWPGQQAPGQQARGQQAPGQQTPWPPAGPIGMATPVPPPVSPYGMATPVPPPVSPYGMATPVPPPLGQAPSARKGKGGRIAVIAGVAGVVVVAGLVGLAWLGASGGDPNDEPTASSSSSASASDSASASPSEDAAWESAQADFKTYRQGRKGAWSDPVQVTGSWDALAVQGEDEAITIHTYLAEPGATWFWMAGETVGQDWGGFTDFRFEPVDATATGTKDILVRAKKSDGTWTGLVALENGEFARFLEDDQAYVGYYNLNSTGKGLFVEDEPDKSFVFDPDSSEFTVKVG